MFDILIVDDEERIREGIKSSIEWEKYGINTPRTAGGGFEALNFIEHFIPNVIILDIKMSDIDGLELLEIIHKKYQNIKIILISGYDDFSYAQKAISLNAYCYLLKPLDHKEILEKVLEIKQIIEEQLQKIKKDKEFSEKFETNIPVLRDTFFTQLVNGKIINSDIFREKADFLQLNLNGSQFLILTLDFDERYGGKKVNIYEQNILKSAVMSKTETLFQKEYRCYCFNLEDDAGILINGDNIDKKNVREISRDLKEWVNSSLGVSITIGIGDIYNDFSGAVHSYREALDALAYKMILGKNEIIDIDSFSNDNKTKLTETNFEKILMEKESDLVYALKTENNNEIEKIFEEIAGTLQNAIKTNIKSKKNILFLYSFFLTKLLISLDMDIQSFLDEENNLHTVLQNLKTINDINDFTRSFLEKVRGELKSRQEKTSSFLVNKAKEFIKDNVYGDSSLTRVANYLYVHPNYLSKIFKQELDESFIEYRTTVKMKEAQELLKKTNLKVYEIAEKLQYNDINHFTKLFKKTFCVSPTEYRELL